MSGKGALSVCDQILAVDRGTGPRTARLQSLRTALVSCDGAAIVGLEEAVFGGGPAPGDASSAAFGTSAVFTARTCLTDLEELELKRSGKARLRQSTEAEIVRVEGELLAAELRVLECWQAIEAGKGSSVAAAEIW